MVRFPIFGLIFLSLVFQSCGNSSAQKNSGKILSDNKGFAVVELFTSEGCSSCPPADDLAITIQKNAIKSGQNIFVLCEHVDYWNHLGWKDPFSKAFFSERQKWYAGFLKDEGIYTPQMVVNGTISFVGSDENKSEKAINASLSSTNTKNRVLEITTKDFNSGNFSYSLPPIKNEEILHVVLIEKNVTSNVLRGENKGRTLHHNNVVRDWITLEHPSPSGSVQFNTDSLQFDKDKFEVAAFIQDKNNGEISAVTSLK